MARRLSETCRKGHRWTDANTVLFKQQNGSIGRACRTCKQNRENAYRKAHPDITKPMAAATKASAKARGLAPQDPRHGTLNGYQHWGCRCGECRQANATATRVLLLKRKARKLGVMPKERNQIRSVSSLDLVAERRFGMDRVMTGSVWDDPTADEALAG